jgi:hypothetical protein
MTVEEFKQVAFEHPGEWWMCKVLSVNLEKNTIELGVSRTIMEKGVHAGFVYVDFTGITE